MGVHSGEHGAVDSIGGVRQWSINHTSAPKPFVASNTLGGTGTVPGIQDWTGSASMFGGNPSKMPGETFTFAGYTAPSDDVAGSNGDVYSGPAIVDSIVITWNYESGDILSHVMNFGGNGPLVESSGLYEDETTPDYYGTAELAAVTGDGEDICNITTITLTLSKPSKPYVNSCTGGWNKRKPGIFSWTLAIAVHDTNASQFVGTVGDNLDISLPINTDGDVWRLRWCHFKERTGLTVNPETNEIIGFTANFDKNGFARIDGVMTPGCLIRPGETEAWWGVTPE